MLDRLPLSLQQHILLEWLSPTAVCRVARAGSSGIRHAVLTSPSAFRAAEGEVLSDACVRWYQKQRTSSTTPPTPKLVLWTSEETVPTREMYMPGVGNFQVSGRVYYRCNGRYHRDGDEPAILRTDGSRMWWKHGVIHRDGDKPADIAADGSEKWFQNGKLHRDGDEPAMICADGSMAWYKNGEMHRDDDQPAIVDANGTQFWYQNGKPHRDGDKPAQIWAHGMRKWYQHGVLYRED